MAVPYRVKNHLLFAEKKKKKRTLFTVKPKDKGAQVSRMDLEKDVS